MSNKIEHDYTDEIICPWCGYSDSDSWEVVDGLWECENCEKSFYVGRNVEVTYSTQKANYGTCKHCGKEDVPIENCRSAIAKIRKFMPILRDKERRRMFNEYAKVLDERRERS